MTRKRIATVVYAVFGAGVGAFVIASIVQVVRVSFQPAPPTAASPACASGIRSLLTAVDRAAKHWEGASEPAAFTAALAPEWDHKEEVSQSCAGSSDDLDAFAEVLRLERILEQNAVRRAAEAGPLRKRLETRIGAPQKGLEGRK